MSSWDDLERQWRDMQASEREHSHVSGETFRKISEVVAAAIEASRSLGLKGAPTQTIARLIVEDLEADELEEIVCDWLEGRGNLGEL